MTTDERAALMWRMSRTAGDLAAAGPDGAMIRGDKTEQFANDIAALCAEVERLSSMPADWQVLHQRCQLAEAEVERLTRQRDAAVAQVETTRNVWEHQAREYNDERYEARAEVTRLTAEVERLRDATQKAGQSLADLSDTDAAYLGGWGGLVGTLSHRLLDAARTTTGGTDA